MSMLLEAVRSTKTLEGGVNIYKDSLISLKIFDPESVSPTSKYVLMGSIRRLQVVRERLLDQGVDIFHLRELIQFDGHTIAPPIVEYSEEDSANLIVDGIHRFFLAREVGQMVTAVYVQQVPRELPVIGLPVAWSEVARCEELPKYGYERRRLRPTIPDDPAILRKFYRDYSSLGSTGRRPSVGQEG